MEPATAIQNAALLGVGNRVCPLQFGKANAKRSFAKSYIGMSTLLM
jgi:hypothetical protein